MSNTPHHIITIECRPNFDSKASSLPSHGPQQVEACPPGGTPLRRKLSSRFVDAMTEFVGSSGDEMAFFKGRQWIPRGVRYPTEGADVEADEECHDGMEGGGGLGSTPSTAKTTAAESAEEALAAAVDEVCGPASNRGRLCVAAFMLVSQPREV